MNESQLTPPKVEKKHFLLQDFSNVENSHSTSTFDPSSFEMERTQFASENRNLKSVFDFDFDAPGKVKSVFKGKKFFVLPEIKMRERVLLAVKRNGGKVVKRENSAKFVVYPLKSRFSITTFKQRSVTAIWVMGCVRTGKILNERDELLFRPIFVKKGAENYFKRRPKFFLDFLSVEKSLEKNLRTLRTLIEVLGGDIFESFRYVADTVDYYVLVGETAQDGENYLQAQSLGIPLMREAYFFECAKAGRWVKPKDCFLGGRLPSVEKQKVSKVGDPVKNMSQDSVDLMDDFEEEEKDLEEEDYDDESELFSLEETGTVMKEQVLSEGSPGRPFSLINVDTADEVGTPHFGFYSGELLKTPPQSNSQRVICRRESPFKRKLHFCVTNVKESEIDGLSKVIDSLGGEVQNHVDTNTTHLVCRTVKMNEKLIKALLKGIYIVTPEFVTESQKFECFADEQLYLVNGRFGNIVQSCQPSQNGRRAFYGWSIGVCFKVNSSFERVMTFGEAKVLLLNEKSLPSGITHVFVDKKKMFENRKRYLRVLKNYVDSAIFLYFHHLEKVLEDPKNNPRAYAVNVMLKNMIKNSVNKRGRGEDSDKGVFHPPQKRRRKNCE